MYDNPKHLNIVIDKLENNKLVVGLCVLSLDPVNARFIIEYNGYPSQEEALNKPMIDFLFIDLEHMPFDITKLNTFLHSLVSRREIAAKGNIQPNMAAFVRIPTEGRDPMHAMIKQVLDIGVHGVIIPQVRTPEEVLEVVKACRYPRPENYPYKYPEGNRGAAPGSAAFMWGVSEDEYIRRADVWPLNPDGDIFVTAIIENVEGLNNIDEILKVPGLGAIFFGPYDFSFSAGKFGDITDRVVVKAQEKVKKACDKAGIPLIVYTNPGNIGELLAEQNKMLILGLDVVKTADNDNVMNYIKKHNKTK